jgi:transcriptional regulator with XRE-family HTH domain
MGVQWGTFGWRVQMNEIEKVKAQLVRKYPDAKVELTAPARKDGVWWVDVVSNGKHLVIEWSSSTGFGITTPDADSFAERADEAYPTIAKLLSRVEQLLVNDDRTSPPFSVLLARLREKRGVTQQDLASRLGVRQASISGLERRQDVQLSTLRKVVHALGGCVQIYARFPEGRFALEDPFCENKVVVKDEVSSEVFVRETKVFVHLKNCGKIERAMNLADRVRRHHSVIEMV